MKKHNPQSIVIKFRDGEQLNCLFDKLNISGGYVELKFDNRPDKKFALTEILEIRVLPHVEEK